MTQVNGYGNDYGGDGYCPWNMGNYGDDGIGNGYCPWNVGNYGDDGIGKSYYPWNVGNYGDDGVGKGYGIQWNSWFVDGCGIVEFLKMMWYGNEDGIENSDFGICSYVYEVGFAAMVLMSVFGFIYVLWNFIMRMRLKKFILCRAFNSKNVKYGLRIMIIGFLILGINGSEYDRKNYQDGEGSSKLTRDVNLLMDKEKEDAENKKLAEQDKRLLAAQAWFTLFKWISYAVILMFPQEFLNSEYGEYSKHMSTPSMFSFSFIFGLSFIIRCVGMKVGLKRQKKFGKILYDKLIENLGKYWKKFLAFQVEASMHVIGFEFGLTILTFEKFSFYQAYIIFSIVVEIICILMSVYRK